MARLCFGRVAACILIVLSLLFPLSAKDGESLYGTMSVGPSYGVVDLGSSAGCLSASTSFRLGFAPAGCIGFHVLLCGGYSYPMFQFGSFSDLPSHARLGAGCGMMIGKGTFLVALDALCLVSFVGESVVVEPCISAEPLFLFSGLALSADVGFSLPVWYAPVSSSWSAGVALVFSIAPQDRS